MDDASSLSYMRRGIFHHCNPLIAANTPCIFYLFSWWQAMLASRAFLRHVVRAAAGTRGRSFSLPAHEVVGLPALSPTMEAGTIASWKVDEGSSFSIRKLGERIYFPKTGNPGKKIRE